MDVRFAHNRQANKILNVYSMSMDIVKTHLSFVVPGPAVWGVELEMPARVNFVNVTTTGDHSGKTRYGVNLIKTATFHFLNFTICS